MAHKVQAKDHESYLSYSLISFIFPIIGIILSIVMLSKDKPVDRKLGEHILVCSIIGLILIALLWVAVLTFTYTPEDDILLI